MIKCVKKQIIVFGLLNLFLIPVYAQQSLGSVSNNVLGLVDFMGEYLMHISYVIGFICGVGALIQYKNHRDNPIQVPLGKPILLLIMGLIFVLMPLLYAVASKAQ